MTIENVEFLFEHQLSAELENIIKEAQEYILLISPYIKIDRRIKGALDEKRGNPEFRIQVLFGKNDKDRLSSIDADSVKFLKEFPNIDIRYNHMLHAKYYSNESKCLFTSMNLHEYSIAQNIEFGILIKHNYHGKILRSLEDSLKQLAEKTDKMKSELLGKKLEQNPIDKFNQIFESSDRIFKTEPILRKKSGISGILGAQELERIDVIHDNFNSLFTPAKQPLTDKPKQVQSAFQKEEKPKSINIKLLSARKISEQYGIQVELIVQQFLQAGLITQDKRITNLGKEKGLEMKNYKGKDYIAYPENLEELAELLRSKQNK